jgi:hypothetical protein
MSRLKKAILRLRGRRSGWSSVAPEEPEQTDQLLPPPPAYEEVADSGQAQDDGGEGPSQPRTTQERGKKKKKRKKRKQKAEEPEEEDPELEVEEIEVAVALVEPIDAVTVYKWCIVNDIRSAGNLIGFVVMLEFPTTARIIHDIGKTLFGSRSDGEDLPALADSRTPLHPLRKYRTKHTLTVAGYMMVFGTTPTLDDLELAEEGINRPQNPITAVSRFDRSFQYRLGARVQAGGSPRRGHGAVAGCGSGIHFFASAEGAMRYGGGAYCVQAGPTILPAGPSVSA